MAGGSISPLKMKNKVAGTWDLIKISLQNFASSHPYRSLYLVVIVLLSFARNMTYLFTIKLRDSADSLPIRTYLLKAALIHFIFFSLDFLKHFLFDRQLAKMGTRFATHIMRNLLYTDNNELNRLHGGQIEYYVSEGAKAFAKIVRSLIMGILSKSVYLAIDLYLVYTKDESDKKSMFMISVACTAVVVAVRFFQLRRTMPHVLRMHDHSFEREKVFTEIVDYIPVVKTYGDEENMLAKYANRTQLWQNEHMEFKYKTFTNDLVYNYLGVVLNHIVVVYYLQTHAFAGAERVRTLATMLLDTVKSCSAAIKIHKELEETYIVAKTIIQYIFMTKSITDSVRVATFRDELAIRNLTYSIKEREIFNDVTFTLGRGDKAALYGPNGMGKSSLFKLLLNFDDYVGGIYLDGMNIEHIDMISYRSLITYVPQDTRLFDETVYHNLIFGNGRPMAEVVAECKKIGLHDKIMSLPKGYNTIVGELGKNINGGLRQKIFYARAFLRDTPIYLFDEPTNNLDKANSEFLLEYINDPAYKDKTFLVICHDMEIVRQFPKIYKFDASKIILEKSSV